MAKPLEADALLGRVLMVLHHTRSAENVGGAARALSNMGLGRLVLAEPAAWDRSRASRVAALAEETLDEALVVPTLEDALDRATLVVATSAKPRSSYPTLGPEAAARVLLEEAARGGAPALLFGDERNGLPRLAFDRAHAVSTIPTAEASSSLNLAQAVMVHAYELRRAALGPEPLPSLGGPEDEPMAAADLARLRSLGTRLLLEAGYLNPDQPDRVFGELERLLVKSKPTKRDGHLLLALVRQLEWAVGRGAG